MLKVQVVMSVSEAVNGTCFLEVGRWWCLDEPRVPGEAGYGFIPSVGNDVQSRRFKDKTCTLHVEITVADLSIYTKPDKIVKYARHKISACPRPPHAANPQTCLREGGSSCCT